MNLRVFYALWLVLARPPGDRVWAYARVSTRDQNPQLQLDALEASGYDTLVQEKESAKRGVLRPAWQELLPLPQPGDTLKFWKSDRWAAAPPTCWPPSTSSATMASR